MGKASSAKKVARAARSSEHKSAAQLQLGYPLALVVLILLGFALVTYARQSGGTAGARVVQPGDQNAAYGIYVCDHFVIDAFGVVGAGQSFPVMFKDSNTSVTDSEIKLPKASPYDGRVYKVGTTTCNGKPATIEVAHWAKATAAETTKPDHVYTTGFSHIKAIGDLSAMTIAFVPKGTAILAPPNASSLSQDSVATAGEPTATTTTTTLALNGQAPATSAPASGGTSTP